MAKQEERPGIPEAARAELETLVRRQLELIGENPEREGLARTPRRVAQALSFLTRGYEQDPLGFAEAPAATRRELSDEELERLGAALLTRAERRRHAAALEAAAAPLLIKLRDAERRLV